MPIVIKPKFKRIGISAACVTAVIGGGYYLASPYLAIQELRNGFLSRNADQVNKYIDYRALQEDLKPQLGAMMLRSMQNNPEIAANPFSGFAAALVTPVVNSMVDTYITPSGMRAILESSASEQGDISQDQTAQNLIEGKREFDKALEKISMGYKGLNEFQLTASVNDGKKIKLLFSRQGFAGWQLKAVVLPQL